jgi:hypothetical protein
MKQCGECWKYFHKAGPKKSCPFCESKAIGNVSTFNGYTVHSRRYDLNQYLLAVTRHNNLVNGIETVEEKPDPTEEFHLEEGYDEYEEEEVSV